MIGLLRIARSDGFARPRSAPSGIRLSSGELGALALELTSAVNFTLSSKIAIAGNHVLPSGGGAVLHEPHASTKAQESPVSSLQSLMDPPHDKS